MVPVPEISLYIVVTHRCVTERNNGRWNQHGVQTTELTLWANDLEVFLPGVLTDTVVHYVNALAFCELDDLLGSIWVVRVDDVISPE